MSVMTRWRGEPSEADASEERRSERGVISKGEKTTEGEFRAQVRIALLAPHYAFVNNAHVIRRLITCGQIDVQVQSSGDPIPPGVRPVVVAPTTAHALNQAARMITAWHPDVPRPVLLLTADAPLPPPPIVDYHVRALEERVVKVLRLRYLADLRAVVDPRDCLPVPGTRPTRTQRRVYRHVRRLRDQILQLPHDFSQNN
ncbi:hypothetical protein GCM10027294_53160 [Marinactinospora endophytica]